MRPGRLIRHPAVTEELMRDNPDWIFVFGDNMGGFGKGGQAAVMRGKPNAVGVPTKWRPSWEEEAFFRDSDFQSTAVRMAITEPFRRVRRELMSGRTVVIPAAGLGTERAQLQQRAPVIYGYIGGWITALEDIASEAEAEGTPNEPS
jgi:hypothetical protein